MEPRALPSEGKDLSTEHLQGVCPQPVPAGVSIPFLTQPGLQSDDTSHYCLCHPPLPGRLCVLSDSQATRVLPVLGPAYLFVSLMTAVSIRAVLTADQRPGTWQRDPFSELCLHLCSQITPDSCIQRPLPKDNSM